MGSVGRRSPPGDGPESCYPPAEDFVNTPSDLSLGWAGLGWAGLGIGMTGDGCSDIYHKHLHKSPTCKYDKMSGQKDCNIY